MKPPRTLLRYTEAGLPERCDQGEGHLLNISRGRRPISGGKRAALAVFALAAGLLPQMPVLAQAPVPDGFWEVRGRGLGNRCADWRVGLAVEQGRLTGIIGLYSGNVPLQKTVLQPDGIFSAETAATHRLNKYVPPYQVTGRFMGDMVSVNLKSVYCPDRRGTAYRHWTGY
jgi:hypothetical protein